MPRKCCACRLTRSYDCRHSKKSKSQDRLLMCSTHLACFTLMSAETPTTLVLQLRMSKCRHRRQCLSTRQRNSLTALQRSKRTKEAALAKCARLEVSQTTSNHSLCAGSAIHIQHLALGRDLLADKMPPQTLQAIDEPR